MEITRTYLANRFGVKERTIREYVAKGILPPPSRTGRGATYDPICINLLEQLTYVRDYLSVSLEELAERRQLTGQLLPPDGRKPPVAARGPV